MQKFLFLIAASALFQACSVGRRSVDERYSPQQLQEDYTLLRKILEQNHPALYWYTPKDSMDAYFDSGYQRIRDSMTFEAFNWKILAPLLHQVRCGHTSAEPPRHIRFNGKDSVGFFPLHLKIWKDTMVVMDNLNKKDSIIRYGTVITSINGMRPIALMQQMLNVLPLDGYADNVNYIRVSGNFPYYYRAVFGTSDKYEVHYLDSLGKEHSVLLDPFVVSKDSTENKRKRISHRQQKQAWTEDQRSLQIDTTLRTAVLTLNTFSRGNGLHLRTFFRKSFRTMRKDSIQNCILDLRSNGGGEINRYVSLTRYLRHTPFKVADSAYAVKRSLGAYRSYISQGFLDNLGLFFLTKKRADGNYHFWYWEKKKFHPKRKNHFNGNVYVLINGSTFSASTLFCQAVKGQSNITIIGEEAGGGAYGNSGIMIPEITLPHTGLRVRLPLFKIVQYCHPVKDGHGVVPDIFLDPTVEGIRNKEDRKMLLVRQLIRQRTAKDE